MDLFETVKFYEFIEKICEQRRLTVMTLTVKSFFLMSSTTYYEEIARERDATDLGCYYMNVIGELPNAHNIEAWRSFMAENKCHKQWWHNLCQDIYVGGTETIAQVMAEDPQNPEKLESIANWVSHDELFDAVEELYNFE